MATQQFMGSGQLIKRLTAQLREQGLKDPQAAALEILRKRGQVDKDGKLTEAGKKRDAMTAEQRALDRYARSRSRDYVKNAVYNPKTNRVRQR